MAEPEDRADAWGEAWWQSVGSEQEETGRHAELRPSKRSPAFDPDHGGAEPNARDPSLRGVLATSLSDWDCECL